MQWKIMASFNWCPPNVQIELEIGDTKLNPLSADYLFIDCETTGLSPACDLCAANLHLWPHTVSIGWLLYDEEKKARSRRYYVIKPEGFVIPRSSEKIHGITHDFAMKNGERLVKVLDELFMEALRAKYVIGHNVEFDLVMLSAECERILKEPFHRYLTPICTMKHGQAICRISSVNGRGYKFPQLRELHRFLFHEDPRRSHNALSDAETCARCFFKLMDLGVCVLGP